MEFNFEEYFAKIAKYQEYINYCMMMGIPFEKIPANVPKEDFGAFMYVFTNMLYQYGFLQ